MAVPVWEGWKVWRVGVSDLCTCHTVGLGPLRSLSPFTACQESGWPRLAPASTQSHYFAFSLCPNSCQSLWPYASPISHLISLLLPFPVSLTLSFLCPVFCHCVFLCSQALVLRVCTIVFLLFCPGTRLILAISGTDLSSSPRT